MTDKKVTPIMGLFLLVDRRSEKGLTRWMEELTRRKMPALIMADGYTINARPDLIQEVIKRKFTVGGLYNEWALWSENHEDLIAWLPGWLKIEKAYLKSPYEIQKIIMHHLNDKLAPLLGSTMPVYSGKYFSYDENTLKIADELGVQYILARGTERERAVFYQPEEYNPTIISVSNVPSKELGTGSLCDESLQSRNETPEDFQRLLLNLNVDRVILVAQTHLSGVDQAWWDIYRSFFDSKRVIWQSLEEFVTEPARMPYSEIPVNKRAEYMAINLQEAKNAGRMV